MRPTSGAGGVRMMWPKPGPVVTVLLAANVALYVLQLVLLRLGFGFVQDLYLSPRDVFEHGAVWQPFTYMWLHSPTEPTHLLFNMLWLWMMGAPLERWWGPKRFVFAYLLFGLSGAALTLLVGLVAHSGILGAWLASFWVSPHLGASGGVMGLTVAWGLVYASQTMNLLILGEMKGKTFVWLMVGWELLTALSLNNVSSTSHFGGMIAAAVLHLRLWDPRAWGQLTRRASLEHKRRQIERELRVIEGGRSSAPPSPTPKAPTKKSDWN